MAGNYNPFEGNYTGYGRGATAGQHTFFSPSPMTAVSTVDPSLNTPDTPPGALSGLPMVPKKPYVFDENLDDSQPPVEPIRGYEEYGYEAQVDKTKGLALASDITAGLGILGLPGAGIASTFLGYMTDQERDALAQEYGFDPNLDTNPNAGGFHTLGSRISRAVGLGKAHDLLDKGLKTALDPLTNTAKKGPMSWNTWTVPELEKSLGTKYGRINWGPLRGTQPPPAAPVVRHGPWREHITKPVVRRHKPKPALMAISTPPSPYNPALETDHHDQSSDDYADPGYGKIICTMMNRMYGLGEYRIKQWLLYSKRHLKEEHQLGYHKLYCRLVSKMPSNKFIAKVLSHLADRRTNDIVAEMKGTKRDQLGRLYRAVLIDKPSYLVGLMIKKNWIQPADISVLQEG